jgi:hypothetical protein
MNAAELKAYNALQLTVPLTQVSKLIDVNNKVIDFITATNDDEFPTWLIGLTFQTDGTGAGRYCKHPDTDGKLRIFETKVINNIGNTPPPDPLVAENTFWKEISSSASAVLPEWAAGLFTSGLKIVYHNHSTDGRGLYLLLEPVRPFNSINIETEITAGKWDRVGGVEEKFASDPTLSIPSGFTAMQAMIDALTSDVPGDAVLYDDSSELLYDDNTNVLYDE